MRIESVCNFYKRVKSLAGSALAKKLKQGEPTHDLVKPATNYSNLSQDCIKPLKRLSVLWPKITSLMKRLSLK